jgi:hypothetical protein
MFEEALVLATDHPAIWLQAPALIGLALAEAIDGDVETAARRLGGVERLRASGGIGNILSNFQLRAERATALARSALGEERLAAALAEGRSDMLASERAP